MPEGRLVQTNEKINATAPIQEQKHLIEHKIITAREMKRALTFTAPVLSSSTPTASKFNLFVLGTRPAAKK